MAARTTGGVTVAGGRPASPDFARLRAPTNCGSRVTRIHDLEEFCRLIVHGPEDLLVDLALDAAPQQAGTASFVGPTFAPEELPHASSSRCSTAPKPATSPTCTSSRSATASTSCSNAQRHWTKDWTPRCSRSS